MMTHSKNTVWKERYHAWCTYPHMEAELLDEMMHYSDADIRECFSATLQFGTGGLRGEMGAGTNRMNVYTVARATRGLSRRLLSASASPSCAVAYDSRRNSEAFARVAAAVLAQAGVRVYIYPVLTPTPMLSFAVRHLQCDGGIVITASHNPAQYNGYKVYGADGCQVTDVAAEAIQAMIDGEPDLPAYPLPRFDALLASGQITWIDKAVNAAYYDEVLHHSLYKASTPLHVVYSPLNGAGNVPVREVLARAGNVTVTVVPEQEQPDGHFPTCPYPNPEDQEAMGMAGALAQKLQADLFFATDPDSDRIGVGVPGAQGVRLFSGNELGVLLFDFVCRQLVARDAMPINPVAVKTIVTTDMAEAVAESYGVEMHSVLTGFKYIGETIGMLETFGGADRFIFGFEESCGYLASTFVRDKDAISAALLICEMAAYYKQQGKTLVQGMDALYARHGFFMNRLLSYTFEGIAGTWQVQRIMEVLRDMQDSFLGESIVQSVDYLVDDTGLPRSDVITFLLGDGSTITVRPSGTEPKLKIYITATAADKQHGDACLQSLHNRIERWIDCEEK